MKELSTDEANDHQSSIKQAQEAARELQEVREKLEQKKKDDELRMKQEAEGKNIYYFRVQIFAHFLAEPLFGQNCSKISTKFLNFCDRCVNIN